MSQHLDRRIPLHTVANLRDLGGLPSTGGHVRSGLVYRSASLANLGGPDTSTFEDLGIHTIYDLRTKAEIDAAPDHVPGDVRFLHLDVLAGSAGDLAAGLGALSSNPAALVAQLEDGRGAALMRDSYRNIVGLPSALAAYRAFYLDLIDPARTGNALFHCTTGKDRTGWAAASLLLLLGVDEADVRADYLETNTDLLPALEPIFEKAAAHGVDRALLLPVLGVDISYLETAFDEVRAKFGSIEGYATKGLGLDADQLQALRARFIEAPAA